VGGRERGGELRDIEPPTGLKRLKGPLVVLQAPAVLVVVGRPAPLPWSSSSPSFPLLSGSCWLFQLPFCPACGLTLTEVLESWRAWEVWRERNPDNNGPNGFGFAPIYPDM
jgi:hypothetical protein